MKWASRKVGCLVVICRRRMGSRLARSSRVVSIGREIEGPGSRWMLWRVEVLPGPVQLERAGLCSCLALEVTDPIWLCHMTCQAPVLQGTLIAGTKYGESSTEIFSFCLKQTPCYIAALLQHLCSGLNTIYAECGRLAVLLEGALFGVWPCLHRQVNCFKLS